MPIFAKNCPKLAIWLDVCNSLFKVWESLKNLKVAVFEIDFKQVPLIFRQTTHTYSESWGPVENFLTLKIPYKLRKDEIIIFVQVMCFTAF